MESIVNVDVFFINMIKGIHSGTLDKLMSIVGMLGNKGIIWLVIAIGLIIGKKYRSYGALMIVSMVVSYLIGEVLIKDYVQRLRPFVEFADLTVEIDKPDSYSFPSSSTTIAFAAIGIILNGMKKYSKWALGLACLIGFSRTYFYVHYLSDVVAGALLGLLVSRLIYELYQRFINKSQIES